MKTVLIHSNPCKAFTGFGKCKKHILRYLFDTGKYRIVEFSNGLQWENDLSNRLPWENYGSLPPGFEQMDPKQRQSATYGGHMIDKVMKKVKPDVYIGIEDIWAFDNFHMKPWWNKINVMAWTTLDSLPILPAAVDMAPKLNNYYVWASFAEKAMKEMGYDQVKTLRGCIDTTRFYPFDLPARKKLRESHGIRDNEFIIGFVFRNQLRKSVPNLLDGFKLFQEQHPNLKTKLLLHTHWGEGWDIKRLIEEKNINPELVLTTYFCHKCRRYSIQPFKGQRRDCRSCGNKKSMMTTNTAAGVSDDQLNEIYNLMDVYCHPFTSGGQELPVQEAKLAGLITLVTNYACGEDNATYDSGGIPLEWTEYREPGTQFIKASTSPDSICEKLNFVYNLNPAEKNVYCANARKWVINNFSIEVIGKRLEEIIDNMPEVDYDFDFSNSGLNSKYFPSRDMDDFEFIKDLYENAVNTKVDKNTTGVKVWLERLRNKEIDRSGVVEHFQKTAAQLEAQNKATSLDDVLGDEKPEERLAVVVPESDTDVLMVNSLLGNLKKQYPRHFIYVFTKPEYFALIEDHSCLHKCLPFHPSIDDPFLLEGKGSHYGYFDMAFFPCAVTQKLATYIHNGKDTNTFHLK